MNRRTATAFAPRRSTGRVIWPTTYRHVAPRVVALWLQAVDDLVQRGW